MNPACEVCKGACCEAFESGVELDALPLEYEFREYVAVRGFPKRAVFQVPNCPQLAFDGRCGCYETRPAICREYEPGGEDCQKAIRAKRRSPDTILSLLGISL
jgi:Fe-S-cluster containining protein